QNHSQYHQNSADKGKTPEAIPRTYRFRHSKAGANLLRRLRVWRNTAIRRGIGNLANLCHKTIAMAGHGFDVLETVFAVPQRLAQDPDMLGQVRLFDKTVGPNRPQ